MTRFKPPLISVNLHFRAVAGTTAKGQSLLGSISTSRASLLQGQYNAKLNVSHCTGPQFGFNDVKSTISLYIPKETNILELFL